MKYVGLSFLILLISPLHAEPNFDTWRFSELLVTGLKAARRANDTVQRQTLDEIQAMLAGLNLEIDRGYRRKPELALEKVRQTVLPALQEAWRTEGELGDDEKQRAYLERVLELGLSPAIAAATRQQSQHFFSTHWSDGVFLKNHLVLASTSLGIVGGTTYLAWGPAGPAFFMMSLLGSAFVYADGAAGFAAYNREFFFRYKTNYIGPVSRECELDLLRTHEAPLDGPG